MSVITTLTVMQDDGKRGELSQRSIRLQTIAPKDDQTSSASSSRSRSAHQSTTTLPPRRGLPPRSRSGCWTCRQRKVKCDEGKPVCGQCSRLGHTCDYTHRLIFRDDTGRVLDRMSDGVSTIGCCVWEPVAVGASSAPSSIGSPIDDLPPFAMLTTDEDRERKAELAVPGTFNVIVNPTSFQHLPEYAESFGLGRDGSTVLRRGSLAISTPNSSGREGIADNVSVSGDSNFVILSRFEDPTRRVARDPRSPLSPPTIHRPIIKREESPFLPNLQSPEITALRQFRDVVWKQLIPPDHGFDSSITLLDEASKQFPPLVRAMIALGSLSLGEYGGKDRLESLQKYLETVPELQTSLKSEYDLASDGAFLTHFLMLVYEITTADVEHQDIWLHHIQTLLKITLLRRNIYGAEKFPYIVWWICNIDLDALLSGMGQGTFVGHMLKNDLVPPPSYHLFPLGPDGTSVVYPEERDALPTTLQLDYEVTILAVRLGLLAYEFRNDLTFNTLNLQHKTMAVKVRQSRIFDLQESLRHLWSVPAVHDLSRIQLPVRAQRLLQRAWAMYRACIIYSHTSMWSGQRLDTSPDFDAEIATAAAQILQLAQAAALSNPYNSRFLVFPLFMAGFASTDGHQTMLSLQLIQALENGALGRNTMTTKRALKTVYDRQHERFMHNGHSLDVDWFQIMYEQGLTVVNFGL